MNKNKEVSSAGLMKVELRQFKNLKTQQTPSVSWECLLIIRCYFYKLAAFTAAVNFGNTSNASPIIP